MSKETRTIRPFLGLGALEHAFDQTLLHFGGDRCAPDSSVTAEIAPQEFLARRVALEWASDEEAFSQFRARLARGLQEAQLDPGWLSIVVIAATPYLKFTDVVFEAELTSLDSLVRRCVLTEPARPRALSAPFSGFSVETYLVLNRSLPLQPLRPSAKGSWVARARFRIETALGPALLPPTALTSEIRARFDLPARTVRYLHFGDHEILEPYREQEQPVFYIDEGLLAQLNARRTAAGSKAIQLQLANDFVSAVVRRAATEKEKLQRVGYEDVRDSLLGSVLRIAAGPGAAGEDRERLLRLVASNPEYVLARAEHTIDVASGFAGLLKEAET